MYFFKCTYHTSYTKTSMSTFDQLRKEARLLENDIDTKLISYSKFGASFAQSSYLRDDSSISDTTSLLNGDHVSSSMGLEIEQLLIRLSEINESMSKCGDITASAYVANHRSKLASFNQEFNRIKAQINTAREHAELLTSVRKDISQYKNSVGSRTDNLLRERGAIHSADRLADVVIGQALETKEALASQRNVITGAIGKLRNLGRAFPGIGKLMNSITRRKKRDLIILASFISLCMFLLLFYAFGRGE